MRLTKNGFRRESATTMPQIVGTRNVAIPQNSRLRGIVLPLRQRATMDRSVYRCRFSIPLATKRSSSWRWGCRNLERWHASSILPLPTSLSRVEIICNRPFFPQGYRWEWMERDYSIISPEDEPSPPPPPSIVYGPFPAFKPTFSTPTKIFDITPPVGDYERVFVKWRVTFGGWAPGNCCGQHTDDFHNLLLVVKNNYGPGALSHLNARGPNRNFIRQVWGFNLKHKDKFRWHKGFNPNIWVVGRIYDLEFDFDLVTELITIKMSYAGNVVWETVSPESQRPRVGSIHIGSGDKFVVRFGDSGAEINKSVTVKWRYLLQEFTVFPKAP